MVCCLWGPGFGYFWPVSSCPFTALALLPGSIYWGTGKANSVPSNFEGKGTSRSLSTTPPATVLRFLSEPWEEAAIPNCHFPMLGLWRGKSFNPKNSCLAHSLHPSRAFVLTQQCASYTSDLAASRVHQE